MYTMYTMMSTLCILRILYKSKFMKKIISAIAATQKLYVYNFRWYRFYGLDL